ncbi:MAG: ABC transporter permease subunit [Verrucomicrobia bacterium]|nr:ABC transporter permease subunit [Verrucomicrobiota bacterium]
MFRLQLRNELWKLFGKKRTYIGFAMFLAAELAIVLIFRYNDSARHQLTAPGVEFASSLTCATIITLPVAFILLPLYLALVGGDLVAKEAEDGTLRMILARPISRVRLLGLKWLAGVLFAATQVVALGGFALLFAALWFPWQGMFIVVPGELMAVFDAATGLQRYLGAHLVMISKATTLISLAFMFSCFNIKPAAATILALSVIFTDHILRHIPYFADLKHWFITYHINVWQYVLTPSIPWWRLGESLSILLAFNITFLVVGVTVFQLRDIKS